MILLENAKCVDIDKIDTPAYFFDLDEFGDRVRYVSGCFNNIPLTYSIKANPFLLFDFPTELHHVEVCSPGELALCMKYGISGKKIIYSGVNKEYGDIFKAIAYGVDIATAESRKHVETEQQVACELGCKQKIILRLTSGNQFGMSEEDIVSILENEDKYPNLIFYGVHFYAGTQKKSKQIEKDIEKLCAFLQQIEENLGFKPQLVEIGPGLAVEYFSNEYMEREVAEVERVAEILRKVQDKYPVGIEMGRFLAASCGTYVTSVKDIKRNDDVNYVICDGGIHHLKYYGQTMAMQVPPIRVLTQNKEKKNHYCICGSLCTIADVLVREVELEEVEEGDILAFYRCGAYSVTEGSSLFLSRELPKIFCYNQKNGVFMVRDTVQTFEINAMNRY